MSFYAIKDMSTHTLLVRQAENLISGMIIISNDGTFKISDVDKKTEIDYPTDNSSPYPIKCFKCEYVAYETPIPADVKPSIYQTVNIQGENIQTGNINLNAKQVENDLDTIEAAIRNSNPSFLNRKKKESALELFRNFKDCVTNQKRDDGLFAKFLKVLETLVTSAIIGLVQGLISSIPH